MAKIKAKIKAKILSTTTPLSAQVSAKGLQTRLALHDNGGKCTLESE